jgi:hypothetical protein
MWLFTTNGHLSVGQHVSQPDILEIRTQLPDEAQSVVAMLDSVSGQKHGVKEDMEGDYRYMVAARRAVVAEAVARMVADITYWKLHNSFHADFGEQPGFLMWVNRTGLQVATARKP